MKWSRGEKEMFYAALSLAILMVILAIKLPSMFNWQDAVLGPAYFIVATCLFHFHKPLQIMEDDTVLVTVLVITLFIGLGASLLDNFVVFLVIGMITSLIVCFAEIGCGSFTGFIAITLFLGYGPYICFGVGLGAALKAGLYAGLSAVIFFTIGYLIGIVLGSFAGSFVDVYYWKFAK